jgi:hypothetical protein
MAGTMLEGRTKNVTTQHRGLLHRPHRARTAIRDLHRERTTNVTTTAPPPAGAP